MHQLTAYELAGHKGDLPSDGSPVTRVRYYFDADFTTMRELFPGKRIILLTDENISQLLAEKLSSFPIITIPSGEENKQQSTVDKVISELIRMEADRDTCLVGLGGGVLTDITGYVAAVYMRGISFGLIPSTILAMVDAAIGGKNGVDVGLYKNLVGTIKQPEFILYDYSLLDTLPVQEWVNGFAEVIKHACIKDELLFKTLERYSMHDFQHDRTLLAELAIKNAAIKTSIVIDDEFEQGERRILNFGHTIGHAVENLYHLPHGHAVSIGMVAACNLSEKLHGLHFEDARRVVNLLAKYHLPVDMETDHEKVFEILKMDKKKAGDSMRFILLNKIGSASIRSIPLDELQLYLKEIL